MAGVYWRPIIQPSGDVGPNARRLAGGWARFSRVEMIERGGAREIVPVRAVPADVLDRLTKPRADIAGMRMDAPQIMGIVNATPDSFSDGGDFAQTQAAVAAAQRLVDEGAAIVDIGGESTRPGADFVSDEAEIARTVPAIQALVQSDLSAPISIDTRKPHVAKDAMAAGAALYNDVSALSYETDAAHKAAQLKVPVCLMHSAGDPKIMQARTDYADVVLDIYDYLADRMAFAVAAGVAADQIVVDPGIGFGKTPEQSVALTQNLSIFHGLGVPVLYGASRKSFIGAIAGVKEPKDRLPGSLAVATEAARQGAQLLRVHDVAATNQALDLAKLVLF